MSIFTKAFLKGLNNQELRNFLEVLKEFVGEEKTCPDLRERYEPFMVNVVQSMTERERINMLMEVSDALADRLAIASKSLLDIGIGQGEKLKKMLEKANKNHVPKPKTPYEVPSPVKITPFGPGSDDGLSYPCIHCGEKRSIYCSTCFNPKCPSHGFTGRPVVMYSVGEIRPDAY